MSLFVLSHSLAAPRRGPSLVRTYLVPLVSTTLVTGLLIWVPAMGAYPLIHYVSAVVVSAWLGGLWPGLFATVLGALAAEYFFLPPLSGIDPVQGAPVLAYLVICSATSRIIEAFHRVRRRLEIALAATENQRAALVDSQERLRLAHADVYRLSQNEHEGRKRAEGALRTAEEQLRQAQKMEAVGRLAGGIAHDFNNMLTVILSYSVILRNRLQQQGAAYEDVEEISRAGQRAAELTQQLLAFSRRQVLQPKVVDLNQVVAGLRPMVERLIGEDIELVIRAAPELPRVMCDAGQIEQVIMNLVLNARDAMPGGGQLVIETGAGSAPETAPGWAMLAVHDTGAGMDEQTRQRIFEPFFTTKEKGRGTGLGLSTAYGIVQQSGGHISVESQPGQGSVFRMWLPPTDAVVETQEATLAPRPARRSGTETVLLVEDEAQLRVLMGGILERDGYQVLQASNGSEAMLVCEGHSGPIDLIVSDVVMPVMSGRELIERVAVLRPQVRVLFVSGYTDDVIGHHGVLGDDVAFLAKPLTPERLLARVRDVLDAPETRFRAETFARRQEPGTTRR